MVLILIKIQNDFVLVPTLFELCLLTCEKMLLFTYRLSVILKNFNFAHSDDDDNIFFSRRLKNATVYEKQSLDSKVYCKLK